MTTQCKQVRKKPGGGTNTTLLLLSTSRSLLRQMRISCYYTIVKKSHSSNFEYVKGQMKILSMGCTWGDGKWKKWISVIYFCFSKDCLIYKKSNSIGILMKPTPLQFHYFIRKKLQIYWKIKHVLFIFYFITQIYKLY